MLYPEQLLSCVLMSDHMVDDNIRNKSAMGKYRQGFEREANVTLSGDITSGLGNARHFLSLQGYTEQFKEKIGYEPFPGTLNIELSEESIHKRTKLNTFDCVTIEGWEDKERTYGPVYCYPAKIEVAGRFYTTVHMIKPKRTRHGDNLIEIIAPVKLREKLPCNDGDYVSAHVQK